MTSASSDKKISSKFIYFFGSFGGILFGYDIGVMTGALPFLQVDWPSIRPDSFAAGAETSSVMFGAIFGGALAGQLADRLGRRRMILISALVFVVGSILSGVSPYNGLVFLICARIILGLAVGAASALVPAYMSEMAPARLRGSLSGINQTMIVSGMLISYVVDFLLKDLPTSWGWRLMLALAAVPALILFLGVLNLPESPRYLVRRGPSPRPGGCWATSAGPRTSTPRSPTSRGPPRSRSRPPRRRRGPACSTRSTATS